MYALLKDNTKIENVSGSSSIYSIVAIRPTYGEAGAVRDLFTDENTSVIRLYNDDDTEVASGAGCILLDGASLTPTAGGVLCEIHLRAKTEMELMHDEITELQDVVLESI